MSKFPELKRPSIHNKYGKIHCALLRNNPGKYVPPPLSKIPEVIICSIKVNVWWFDRAGWCWSYQVEALDRRLNHSDFGDCVIKHESGAEFESRKTVYEVAAIAEAALAKCLKELGCQMPDLEYKYGERN